MIGWMGPVGLMDIIQMLVKTLSTSALIWFNVDADRNFMGKGSLQQQRNDSV